MALDFGKLKILVVNADPAQSKELKAILHGFGTGRIDHASDAAKAIALLKPGRLYDLILCAFALDTINGLSLVKAIRRDNRLTNRYTPVIMITGRLSFERQAMIRAAGVNDILTRPISGHMLHGAIQSALGRTRSFVETRSYFGPDRRLTQHDGMRGRRRGDSKVIEASEEPWYM